jgi:hypothetical protein
MSRHFAAYFAIVGTLAFVPAGAAGAGQVNIPHINIPRPQISIPTPHPSVPPPHLSVPTLHPSISKVITPPAPSVKLINKAGKASVDKKVSQDAATNFSGVSKHVVIPDQQGAKGGDMSPAGSASATTYSNTSGSYSTGPAQGSPSYSGGYSTVGIRCRSKGGASNCPG